MVCGGCWALVGNTAAVRVACEAMGRMEAKGVSPAARRCCDTTPDTLAEWAATQRTHHYTRSVLAHTLCIY